MRTLRVAAALAFSFSFASTVGAQPAAETRQSIGKKAHAGDRLTITTNSGQRLHGKLFDLGVDALVLEDGINKRSISYRDIDRVGRRKNGFLLGTIIGTAAGLAAGWPVYELGLNETGEGAKDYALVVVGGAAVGFAIDAALSKNRTIYRAQRPSGAGVQLQPQKRGVALNWRSTW